MNNPTSCDAILKGTMCPDLECERIGLCNREEMTFPLFSEDDVGPRFVGMAAAIGAWTVSFFNWPQMALDETKAWDRHELKKTPVFPEQLQRFYLRFPGQFRNRKNENVEPDLLNLWLSADQIKLDAERDPNEIWEDELDDQMRVPERISQWYDHNLSKPWAPYPGQPLHKKARWATAGSLLWAWWSCVTRPGYKGPLYFQSFDVDGNLLG